MKLLDYLELSSVRDVCESLKFAKVHVSWWGHTLVSIPELD